MNERVEDIHPIVLNSYTSPDQKIYTVLDLKDAFFSLSLAANSQPLFAFEWHDQETGFHGQLTWTRLPQGFKNSVTIFDDALNEDLSEYCQAHPAINLLQYVGDLLIAADDQHLSCLQATQDLLGTLGHLGYKASAKKGTNLPS